MRAWIGIVLPRKFYNRIKKVQKDVSKKYDVYSSLGSQIGPHITIIYQPNVRIGNFYKIKKTVEEIVKNQTQFCINVNGFAGFTNNVVYVKVVESRELRKLHKMIFNSVNKFGKIKVYRKYKPHITIAFRDLSDDNFRKIHQEYIKKKISFKFTVKEIRFGKARKEGRIRVCDSFRLKRT